LDKPAENRRILKWGDASPNEATAPALQLCEVIDNLHYYNMMRIGMPIARNLLNSLSTKNKGEVN
jgi:hypothetical protein